MIDIKIETNREFKVKMLELGFKKDKFDFFNKLRIQQASANLQQVIEELLNWS